MKIGSIDGTPEEIKNLCENNGLDLTQYIEKPGQHMHKGWLLAPAITFVGCLIASVVVKNNFPNYSMLAFCITLATVCWLAIAVQVKFSNAWATAIACLGLFLIALLSFGYIMPNDVIAEVSKLKN